MAFEPIFAESAPIFVKNSSFHLFKNPHLCLFSWVLEVKLKFQDNSYNRINNNKCPSSEKEDEVCILRNSYFHQIQPTYIDYNNKPQTVSKCFCFPCNFEE